jgi:hypothetical protein
MHGGNTGTTLDHNTSRLGSSGSRAGSRCRDNWAVETGTRLASGTTVRSGASAIAVHGAACTLGPVSADSIVECCTAASILGRHACWDSVGHGVGVSQNWFTRCSCRRRVRRGRAAGCLGHSGSCAAVLAPVCRETVSIRFAAVTILADYVR